MSKEIFYCNLEVLHEGNTVKVKDVVYKDVDGYYYNIPKFKKPVKVLNIEVIKSLGFENTSTQYSYVQKSDEKRNKITGAYE